MNTINIGEGMHFGMGVDISSGLVRGQAIVFDSGSDPQEKTYA
jgi:hypothetical protein